MNTNIVITEAIQNFVRSNSNITELYFDKTGRHYVNVHKLRADKEDTNEKNWEQYGSGVHSHQEVIPGIFNVDKKKESIAKGDPDTMIVETLSRKDILNAEVRKEGDSLLAKVVNSSETEKAAILQQLLPKAAFDAIMAITAPKTEDVASKKPNKSSTKTAATKEEEEEEDVI